MNYGWPHFYTGADDDLLADPSLMADDAADAATAAAAAAQAQAAQQAAFLQQQQLAAQRASLAEQQALLLEETPHIHRHHVWRRHNGTTFRTRLGTPQDFYAQRQAARGHVFRVSGETFAGAAGTALLFTVVSPHGAALRWQDSSVQDDGHVIPHGTTFQGMLRPHDLIEVTTPGYAGWVSVNDTNQIGATRTGAQGGWGPVLDQPQACAPGFWWDAMRGACVPMGPPPPPVIPHVAGADPSLTGRICPPGTYWDDYYGKCLPAHIPIAPSPLPATLSDWHSQHVTSGQWVRDENGALWRLSDDGTFAAAHPEMDDGTQGWPSGGEFAGWGAWGWPTGRFDIPGYYVGAEATPPVQPQAQHPAVPPQGHPVDHAAAHATDAAAHAAQAQSVAAHPAAQGAGADHHAHNAVEHATQSFAHAHMAAQHPDHEHAHEHANRAAAHAHLAERHSRYAHEAGRRGFGREHLERRGLEHGRFGMGRRGFGRIGRYVHAHPEWHGHGHPAWRHGVHPRFAHHRAECARNAGGFFARLFGGRRAHRCHIERIHHPQGHITYRLTPSGAQEGIVLDEGMQQANQQFTIQTQQAAPTEDDGPLPGSDTESNGADEPEKKADDATDTDADATATDDAAATTADDGATDTDADATATDDAATAAAGYFAGLDEYGRDPYALHREFMAPTQHHHHRHHQQQPMPPPHGFEDAQQFGGDDDGAQQAPMYPQHPMHHEQHHEHPQWGGGGWSSQWHHGRGGGWR